MTTATHRGRTALAAVAVAGAAAATWGIGIERHLYTLRQHTVAVLPAGADPIRILHLSDVHMAPWQVRKQAWIASLASLRPDLIVNTGDNLGHPDALRAIRAAYAGFRGVPGVFVYGSNDFFAPTPRNPLRYLTGPSQRGNVEEKPLDTAALDAFLTDTLGWHSVDNGAAALQVRGRRLDFFGVGDAHRDWDRLDELPAYAASVRNEASDLPRLEIGVTHAPYRRVLDAFAAEGADMIFAGHTHGGQVRVPGFGALVANCDLPLDQTRGLSSWDAGTRRIPLNVSAGIGHSIYAPVRFACRPEASLITLVPREG
ncbi:metallophosphoesterase [Microbacterium gorillae]|uniref:metallophosphoesterase n=1 Tax=Microbacterium gorillae TaxID=1231063 RepID=UPI00058D35D0|nr:metallophosphoesterase [Microbacterium gorillae]